MKAQDILKGVQAVLVKSAQVVAVAAVGYAYGRVFRIDPKLTAQACAIFFAADTVFREFPTALVKEEGRKFSISAIMGTVLGTVQVVTFVYLKIISTPGAFAFGFIHFAFLWERLDKAEKAFDAAEKAEDAKQQKA